MKISHFTWSSMAGITFIIVLLGGGLLWIEGATWLALNRGEQLSAAFTTALRIATRTTDKG
jgi:hypothetical protein